MEWLGLVGQILLEGMKTWNGERKARFSRKHKKVMERLLDAENAQPPHYTDSELMLAKEEWIVFKAAYLTEMKDHNEANSGSSSSDS